MTSIAGWSCWGCWPSSSCQLFLIQRSRSERKFKHGHCTCAQGNGSGRQPAVRLSPAPGRADAAIFSPNLTSGGGQAGGQGRCRCRQGARATGQGGAAAGGPGGAGGRAAAGDSGRPGCPPQHALPHRTAQREGGLTPPHTIFVARAKAMASQHSHSRILEWQAAHQQE
jgi:hypothetical protein